MKEESGEWEQKEGSALLPHQLACETTTHVCPSSPSTCTYLQQKKRKKKKEKKGKEKKRKKKERKKAKRKRHTSSLVPVIIRDLSIRNVSSGIQKEIQSSPAATCISAPSKRN
jgi:hypothetical protein